MVVLSRKHSLAVSVLQELIGVRIALDEPWQCVFGPSVWHDVALPGFIQCPNSPYIRFSTAHDKTALNNGAILSSSGLSTCAHGEFTNVILQPSHGP